MVALLHSKMHLMAPSLCDLAFCIGVALLFPTKIIFISIFNVHWVVGSSERQLEMPMAGKVSRQLFPSTLTSTHCSRKQPVSSTVLLLHVIILRELYSSFYFLKKWIPAVFVLQALSSSSFSQSAWCVATTKLNKWTPPSQNDKSKFHAEPPAFSSLRRSACLHRRTTCKAPIYGHQGKSQKFISCWPSIHSVLSNLYLSEDQTRNRQWNGDIRAVNECEKVLRRKVVSCWSSVFLILRKIKLELGYETKISKQLTNLEKFFDEKPTFANRVRVIELGISGEGSASLFKDPDFTSVLQLFAKSPMPPHELHFSGSLDAAIVVRQLTESFFSQTLTILCVEDIANFPLPLLLICPRLREVT